MIELLPADLILVRGNNLLSDAICHFEGPAACVSHVAGVVSSPSRIVDENGTLVHPGNTNLTLTMEALQPGFQTRLYGQTVAGAKKAWVMRDLSLTLEQRCAIVAAVVQASCEPYATFDLLLQAADALGHTTLFTDELGPLVMKHAVICSMEWCKAYQTALGKERGLGTKQYDTITPQDVFMAGSDAKRYQLTEVI